MKQYTVVVFERSSLGDWADTLEENLTLEKALNVVQSMTGERFDAHEVAEEVRFKGSFITGERKLIEEYDEDPVYWRNRGYQIIREKESA